MTFTLKKANQTRRDIYWKFKERYFQDFIYIHINKTGGSSIEKALGARFQHRTALEKIAEHGFECWNKKFTFTVVRNPWDRVVSHFHYRLMKDQNNWGERPLDFNTWVKATYDRHDPEFYANPRMFMAQLDWIVDEERNILVNFVARMENLEQDFRFICRRLHRSVTLPHLKKSNRGDYRQYYNEESIEIVRMWAAQDIEVFDYTF